MRLRTQYVPTARKQLTKRTAMRFCPRTRLGGAARDATARRTSTRLQPTALRVGTRLARATEYDNVVMPEPHIDE